MACLRVASPIQLKVPMSLLRAASRLRTISNARALAAGGKALFTETSPNASARARAIPANRKWELLRAPAPTSCGDNSFPDHAVQLWSLRLQRVLFPAP